MRPPEGGLQHEEDYVSDNKILRRLLGGQAGN